MRSVPPCWTQAQKCRLETIGGHASSGKLLGSVGIWADTLEGLEGKKARPIAGRVVYAVRCPIPQTGRGAG